MLKSPEPAHAIPLVDDELAAVGEFIVVWNLVENEIDDIVLDTTRIRLFAIDAIMRSPSVPVRMDIFVELLKSFVRDDEALVADAVGCANSMKALSNFRNEVAHGRWVMARGDWDEEGHRPLQPMSAKPGTLTKPITLRQLADQFDRLCQLSRRVADLHWRCNHRASPERFPLPSPWHGKF